MRGRVSDPDQPLRAAHNLMPPALPGDIYSRVGIEQSCVSEPTRFRSAAEHDNSESKWQKPVTLQIGAPVEEICNISRYSTKSALAFAVLGISTAGSYAALANLLTNDIRLAVGTTTTA